MQRFRKLSNATGVQGTGVTGLTSAAGGTAIADNAVIRGDGTQSIQASGVILDDSDAFMGGRVSNEASLAGVGAPNVLTASESGKTLTNTGAAALCYNTLPAATNVGCWFKFVCMDTDGIRATAAGTDTIRYGASVSAGGGFVRSITVGSVFTVECVASGLWYVTSHEGADASILVDV